VEEIEDPTEAAREALEHHAHHAHESKDPSSRWIQQVALTAAFLALFAAVTSLLAGHYSNEALVDQLKASDAWGYYQAKGIKAAILETKIEILSAQGKTTSPADLEHLAKYKKEQAAIQAEATELTASSRVYLEHHVILARGVTMFQVAIGIAAIAVLIRQKKFWLISLLFAAFGLLFLGYGYIRNDKPHASAAVE
jgi:hypothetical protein